MESSGLSQRMHTFVVNAEGKSWANLDSHRKLAYCETVDVFVCSSN